MSISEHFRYRNDVFQSDIFVSNIRITDVDVGCRISPTLRSMSMSTYGETVQADRQNAGHLPQCAAVAGEHLLNCCHNTSKAANLKGTVL
jgi:hypothetical protein